MSVIGTTLLKSSAAYVTRPEATRALNGVFSVNIRNIESSASVNITVQHRNRDDTSWTSAGTFSEETTTGIKTASVGSLKELVRLSISIGGTNAYGFAHIATMPTRYYADA